MADTFTFELVSPERILKSGEATEVVVPGADGDFTVLPGHAPVLSTLRPGVMDVTLDGEKARIYVKSGLIEVDPKRVTVLAQTAVDMADLDAPRVAEELAAAKAEREAADESDDELIAHTEAAIDALTRMQGRIGER
jgi:F-type H+-transporting ATPase subunit epsilon